MSLSNKEIKQFVSFAADTALGAGRILKKGLTQVKKIDFKGRIDPVTEFDLKSEKYITRAIQKTYPEHSILAEEGSGSENGSQFRWVIDPLDGTVNFSHGFPVYCVSIALEHNGQIIAGVVFDPERDELFSAGLGQGSRMNGKKITVSSECNLQRSLLATGFAYNIGTARRNNLGMFARMMKKAQAVRRLGSAALDLCWVANGRFDGFWEYYLQPWDTAAATLILNEAGGKVTRINGKEYSIFAKDLLASNNHIHTAMKAVLTVGYKAR